MAVPAPDVTAQPRIPRLTYRNPLPPPGPHPPLSDLETSVAAEPSSNSTKSTDTTHATDTSDTFASPAGYLRPSFDSKSTASSAESSLASSHVSTSRSSKACSSSSQKKKKKNAVFSFLTVKEPSQVALDQFAKSHRQQSCASVGLQQHISLQKLPPHLPKVNSKWDGLPESIKSPQPSTVSSVRSIPSSRGDRSLSGYNSTFDTSEISVLSAVSQGPPPSLASPMASVAHVGYGADSTSPVTASLKSPSQTSLLDMYYYFPNDPTSTSGSLSTSPLPWSPPASSPSKSYLGVQEPSHTASLVDDERENEDISTKADAVFRKLQGDRSHRREDDVNAVRADGDNSGVDGVPETHGFLFQLTNPTTPSKSMAVSPSPSAYLPSTMVTPQSHSQASQFVGRSGRLSPSGSSRSRPSSRVLSYRPSPFTLPTLYEASVASTDTIAETESSNDGNSNTRRSMDSLSITESTVESIAPSVRSASWNQTSKDRLGLGGRIRKDGVLPWEQEERAMSGKPKKSRLSVFSKFSVSNT